MRNPITRITRFFKREYPDQVGMAKFGGGMVGVVGSIMLGVGVATGAAPVIALLAAPAIFLGGGALFGGMSAIMPMPFGDDRPDSNSVGVNGFTVVGDKKDVASVYMLQHLLDEMTEKYKHMAELPAKVDRKIMKHVKDIEAKAARVRVYNYKNEQVSEFSFRRKYIDSKNSEAQQNVATVLVLKAPPIAPVVEAAPVAEAPKAVLPQPVASEFSVLSKKVDAIEKRVDEIASDAAPLEKPKLSAPTA